MSVKRLSVTLRTGTFFLCSSAVLPHFSSAQIPPEGIKLANFVSLPLRIKQDQAVSTRWNVIRAELREAVTGLWGLLEIQNISDVAVENARFYAEYFDETGHLCLTLVFATQANAQRLEGDDRPFRSGAVRELLSPAIGLGPALRPVEVHLQVIEEKLQGQAWRRVGGDALIRSPVTFNGQVLEPRFTLGLDESQRASGMVDLIFAKISFDASGNPVDIEVLDSLNAEARNWLYRFIRQRDNAQPATAGLVNATGPALVLVRIANDVEHAETSVLLPRGAAWVKEYVRRVQATGDLPPVTQLLFAPSVRSIRLPTRSPDGAVQPPTERVVDPNLFEYISAGSSWCSSVLDWTLDDVSHRQALSWKAPK